MAKERETRPRRGLDPNSPRVVGEKVASLHRRKMPTGWEVYAPTHTVEELCIGTGDFQLVHRDFELLAALFQRNFLVTRQMTMFHGTKTGSKTASNRMLRLLREGVIARIPIPRMVGKEIGGREYAYSLTRFGLECSISGGNRDAVERQHVWRPPYTTGSDRNNVLHDLSVVDLCNGIELHLAENRIAAGWRSSRYTMQKVHPMMAGGQRFDIVPDAAVILATSDTILIEYEESLRPESFGKRLVDYKNYFLRRFWETEYIKAPKVLISASEEADRQRYWANPFEEVLRMGQAMFTLYPNVFFVKEQMWRSGQWFVQPLAAGEEMIPLLRAILGDQYKK